MGDGCVAAIEMEGVWKRYLLGQARSASGVIKGLLGRRNERDSLWALQDVSLAMEPGETLGIIGRNGAGKTTILKMLSRVTRPTKGEVKTHGRLACLISLGAGFHPELTGRENIYLNGVILGLTRKEIGRRLDEIIAFADLEEFIDTPVKRYSSGMYARLGFAVAAHVDPDILLVDEVLSVGDIGFRDKSYQRMLGFRDSGTALVFVSHNMAAVTQMCERVVWLEQGQVCMDGAADEVVRAYLNDFDRELLESSLEEYRLESGGSGEIVVARVTVHGSDGTERDAFRRGEDVAVRLHYHAREAVTSPMFMVYVVGQSGSLFSGNMVFDGLQPEQLGAGRGIMECRFKEVSLLPAVYRIAVQIKHHVGADYFRRRVMGGFRVDSQPADYGFHNDLALTLGRGGLCVVPYEWVLYEGEHSRTLGGISLAGDTNAALTSAGDAKAK
jgi:lipopolysaccharide transport system ATP-binding protein